MKRLGRTDIEVFPLGLGGIPLRKITVTEAKEVIDASIEGGVNFADTAEYYGDSEQKLSHALRGRREKFIIATKSPHSSGPEFRRAIDQSLARLGTDYVDIYQLHHLKDDEKYDKITAPGGALEVLEEAKRDGKVRFMGVTGHRPHLLVRALKLGVFDTVQVPINVVDQEADQELLPYAQEHDIGIIAMKPFCGGILDNPALALRYCLNKPAHVVLCGMKNVAEVEQNLGTLAAFQPLSQTEEEELLTDVGVLGAEFCRQCEYCQPCPRGVQIPKILWLANYYRRDPDLWVEAEYKALETSVAACEECGDCEELCPYELPIRRMLKEADRSLTPTTAVRAKRQIRKITKKMLRIRGRPE